MSRIKDRFQELRRDKRAGLVTYTTAGDPDLQRSGQVLLTLDRAGADVLEVGVPFSDPLADGPVIQRATERAIAAGTTLTGVLDLVAALRPEIAAPIVIFTYANPVLKMGLDQFVRRARGSGVDGVLTLDVPPEESEQFRAALRVNPEFAEAHSGLGAALATMGDEEGAAAAFAEALRLNPDLVSAHFNVAMLLIRQGRVTLATAHLERAAAIDPDYEPARRVLSALRRRPAG